MSDEPYSARWPTVEAFVLAALEPRLLLRNLEIHRAVAPDERYYGIGLASRMLGEPGGLDQFDEVAADLRGRLERDPAVAARFAALRAMGFRVSLGIYDEPWLRRLMLSLARDTRAEARLRAEAKAAAGVRTRADSEEFDRRLSLFIKQYYAPDWEEWRARYPLVQWP